MPELKNLDHIFVEVLHTGICSSLSVLFVYGPHQLFSRLLLVLCLKITHIRLRGPYGMPVINPGLTTCKVNALHDVPMFFPEGLRSFLG